MCILRIFLFVLLLVTEEGVEGGGGRGGEGGSGRRGSERGDVHGVDMIVVVGMSARSVEARRFAFFFLVVVCSFFVEGRGRSVGEVEYEDECMCVWYLFYRR